MKSLILRLFILLTISSFASAADNYTPQGITLQGTILTPAGQPEEGKSVVFTVQITSPGVTPCTLYVESQTLDMKNSGGAFSLVLGTGSRSGSGFQATSTLAQAFNNSFGLIPGLTCTSGSS